MTARKDIPIGDRGRSFELHGNLQRRAKAFVGDVIRDPSSDSTAGISDLLLDPQRGVLNFLFDDAAYLFIESCLNTPGEGIPRIVPWIDNSHNLAYIGLDVS